MSEITPNTPNPVREDAYKQQLAAKLGIDPQYIPGSPIWHSEEEIAAIAEMFSNMAGGGSSGGGVLVVNITWADDTGTCDKTASEMWTAYRNGGANLVEEGEDGGSVYSIVYAKFEDGEYSFYVENPTNKKWVFSADSGSDYPSYTENNAQY